MELASRYFSGITYRRINAVRKSKEIFFLSDITTSDGLFIDEEALHPIINRTPKANLRWPNQASPGLTAWKEWKTFLTKYVCQNNLRLRQSLGHWLPVQINTQQWYSLIDPISGTHYLFDSDQTWNIGLISGRS